MKWLRTGLLASALAMSVLPVFGETVAALEPWGGWPLCANGIQVQGCSSYVPGTETYMLMIHGDTLMAVAYTWQVTVTLRDGTVKTVSGVVMRDDNTSGYTFVMPLTFGGIATSSTITTNALVILSSNKVEHRPRF